jgi:hypothetical protein
MAAEAQMSSARFIAAMSNALICLTRLISFDGLILSDVLEHLVNPEAVLRRLVTTLNRERWFWLALRTSAIGAMLLNLPGVRSAMPIQDDGFHPFALVHARELSRDVRKGRVWSWIFWTAQPLKLGGSGWSKLRHSLRSSSCRSTCTPLRSGLAVPMNARKSFFWAAAGQIYLFF